MCTWVKVKLDELDVPASSRPNTCAHLVAAMRPVENPSSAINGSELHIANVRAEPATRILARVAGTAAATLRALSA